MLNKIPNPIVDEIKHLVTEGISSELQSASLFTKLHHDLVQHYFKARKVEIDYNSEVVKIELPVGDNYTQVNITCQPLEQFLCSCVKNDEYSLELYKKLLLKFERIEVA